VFPTSLRVRLALWYTLVLAAMLVVLGGALYLLLSRELYAGFDDALRTQVELAVSDVETENGSPRLADEMPRLTDGSILALYDTNGMLVQIFPKNATWPLESPAGLPADAPSEGAFDTVGDASGARWRVLARAVTVRHRPYGVLRYARPLTSVDHLLSRLLIGMLIAFPAALALAVAGGVFLAGRALAPVGRIARAMEEVDEQGLGRRLHLGGANDEVGRLGRLFDQMLDRLDAAFRRQQQFTADASHELRTPLAIMASQLDVTLDRPREPAEYRAALESVREDVDRMSELVRQLLLLARSDADGTAGAWESVDLGVLLEDVADMFGGVAEEAGVAVVAEPRPPVSVAADPTGILQLLTNLVGNAIEHTPRGGRVTLTAEQAEREALLRVADTGEGISAEHQQRIFDRFYRVDASRSRRAGGAGLGLAICQAIAQAHGGRIEVQSAPGHGAVFTVRLPLSA
jgi:heavy metal sensor kinase